MKKSLKQLRKEKGLSVAFVARHLQVSEASIRNKESGRTDFTLPEARALSRLYNVSLDNIEL